MRGTERFRFRRRYRQRRRRFGFEVFQLRRNLAGERAEVIERVEIVDVDVFVARLLAAVARYRELGMMRRFSAVLRHREIGVSANAMGVWIVPPDKRNAFGRLAAEYPAVSHCYERPTYPDWPYSMFTMVHGRSRIDCEATLAAISLASGVKDYTSLYSIQEYKKVRIKYFEPDIEQWDGRAAAAACK